MFQNEISLNFLIYIGVDIAIKRGLSYTPMASNKTKLRKEDCVGFFNWQQKKLKERGLCGTF
jgi:hypothetical protein